MKSTYQSQPHKRKKKKTGFFMKLIYLVFVAFIVFISVNFINNKLFKIFYTSPQRYNTSSEDYSYLPDWIDVQIIDIDGDSRRGELLNGVSDIVVHYVGNPNSTAQQNHDYYDGDDSTVSSHFIVGLDGEIILCVPLSEKSSATNWRNGDTISIEVCHPDETGEFNSTTYDSLVKLTAWLREYYNLEKNNLIRHYDVTGKKCPLYFVNNENKWEQFKNDVINYKN